MAGITSAAQLITTALPLISQGAGLVSSLAGAHASAREQRQKEEISARQLQTQQAEQLRQAQENAALEQQKIALNAQQAEAERKAALKRAVARQRARFGSDGIGAEGGSAQAVLLGLFDESEDERYRREQLDTLKNSALEQNLNQTQRLNVLQLTQLQERNKINQISSRANRFSDIVQAGSGLGRLVRDISES